MIVAAVLIVATICGAFWVTYRMDYEVARELTGTVREVQYIHNHRWPRDGYTIVTMNDGQSVRLEGIQAIDRDRPIVLKVSRSERILK